MDKIIVTGGLGYIGSHTCVVLHEFGYEPIIVDNLSNSNIESLKRIENLIGKKIKMYNCDCRNVLDLSIVFRKESPIHGVIHFAALKSVNESISSPIEYYDNNIVSLINVLKCIDENNIDTFVFSSSCTVYGDPDILPVYETSPTNLQNSPYGFSKFVGENIIRDWSLSSGKSPVVLRYFNPIGAHPSYKMGECSREDPTNIVPRITRSVIKKEKPFLVNGKDYNTPDGTCIRDYVDILDLANAHVKSIEYSKKNLGIEFFNIGTGKGTSIKEILDTFQYVNGVKVEYEFSERRIGDIPWIYANCDKSKKLLGWYPKFTLEDSLKSAWEWEKYLHGN